MAAGATVPPVAPPRGEPMDATNWQEDLPKLQELTEKQYNALSKEQKAQRALLRAKLEEESTGDVLIASMRRQQMLTPEQSSQITCHFIRYLAEHNVPLPLHRIFILLFRPPRRWSTLLDQSQRLVEPQLQADTTMARALNHTTGLPKRSGTAWLLSWARADRVTFDEKGWITMKMAGFRSKELSMARIMVDVKSNWLSRLALSAIGTLLAFELQVPAYRAEYKKLRGLHENAIWAPWMNTLPSTNPVDANKVSPNYTRTFELMERSLQTRILLEVRARAFLSAMQHVSDSFGALPVRRQANPRLQANVEASYIGKVQFRALLQKHRDAIKTLETNLGQETPTDEQLKQFDDLVSTIDSETFELAAMVTQLATKLELEFVNRRRRAWELIDDVCGPSHGPKSRTHDMTDSIKDNVNAVFVRTSRLGLAPPAPSFGDDRMKLDNYLRIDTQFASMWKQGFVPQWPPGT